MIPTNLLPVRHTAFIAGGYAVCPALAGDMDIFVQTEGDDADDVRRGILIHLAENGFEFATEDSKQSEPNEEYPDAIFTRKVARVEIAAGLTAQIMVTDVEHAIDLLNTFDISTCQVALLQNGAVVRGDKWTAPGDPPIAVANYPSTPARMEKYSNRFKPSPDWAVDDMPF